MIVSILLIGWKSPTCGSPDKIQSKRCGKIKRGKWELFKVRIHLLAVFLKRSIWLRFMPVDDNHTKTNWQWTDVDLIGHIACSIHLFLLSFNHFALIFALENHTIPKIVARINHLNFWSNSLIALAINRIVRMKTVRWLHAPVSKFFLRLFHPSIPMRTWIAIRNKSHWSCTKLILCKMECFASIHGGGEFYGAQFA